MFDLSQMSSLHFFNVRSNRLNDYSYFMFLTVFCLYISNMNPVYKIYLINRLMNTLSLQRFMQQYEEVELSALGMGMRKKYCFY